MLGTLSTVTTDFRVGLVNLSSDGVRLSAPELPDEGQEVVFRAGNVQSFGTVVWNKQGQCGVLFEDPMPAADVKILHQQAHLWSYAGFSLDQRAGAWDVRVAPDRA